MTERLENEQSSNLSVTSPTSQLILQPFFHFSYVTGSSLTSPGEPPMVWNAFALRGSHKKCQEMLDQGIEPANWYPQTEKLCVPGRHFSTIGVCLRQYGPYPHFVETKYHPCLLRLQPGGQGKIAGGLEDLISILVLGVSSLYSALCSLWRWPWNCADNTLRETYHCCAPYRHLTDRYLSCKSREV